MNLMQFVQNPQALLQAVVGNSQLMQDPRARKTVELMRNNDSRGLQAMAENLCKEYGTTPEQMMQRLKTF